MEYITGYFTVERNIVNANLRELESKLGLPPGWLAPAARVLVFLQQPLVGQFVFAGSTLTPGADDLVNEKLRRNFPVPGAWLRQRLVWCP
jgi:hypothetical protein